MVAAGQSASHSTSAWCVASEMKLQRCQADTMNANAANAV
jgi:hypothetical protein